jgi:membrane-associated phospholipid phosphatase
MTDRLLRQISCRLIGIICCTLWLVAGGATSATAQTGANQTFQPPVAAPTAMPGVLAEAVKDFGNIPSWSNLAIFAVGGFGAAVGHQSDLAISRSMSGSQSLGSFFRVGETIGGARTQLAAALGTYAIGHFSGQRKVAAVGADLLQAQILAQTMTASIKMSVGRTRPDGTQYSFPSGHSSVTFATATVLQRDLGWKFGVPAYGLATYVAASRIQDRRHFFSDVAFGAAIGIVAGRSVTVGQGSAKFAVAPTAAQGGGGVSFTWLGSNK